MNDISQCSSSTALAQAKFAVDSGEDNASNVLIVFVRAAIPGQVKTRLAAVLGEREAADLYAAMVQDTLTASHAAMTQVGNSTLVVAHTPDDAFAPGPHSLSAYWSGDRLPQHGEDLGAMMLNALNAALANGAKHVVLIGSDAPDLPPAAIALAFARLQETPFVLGPSQDGGFYLIGTSVTLSDEIFADVLWSSETVLEHTLSNAARLDLPTALLDSWRDVDTEEDLESLAQRLAGNTDPTIAPASRQWLRNNRQSRLPPSNGNPTGVPRAGLAHPSKRRDFC